MPAIDTDRIEKTIDLPSPRSRVWRALTNHRDFGTWFGAVLDDPFVAGDTSRGQVTIKGYEQVKLELAIQRIEPERLFSFRWHPYAVEPGADYSAEPTTLVEFTLDDAPGGTRLTVVESGFDGIPVERRATAFGKNNKGWEGQLQNLRRYLTAA